MSMQLEVATHLKASRSFMVTFSWVGVDLQRTPEGQVFKRDWTPCSEYLNSQTLLGGTYMTT